MRDENKTKAQLLNELAEIRRVVARMEAAEAERKQAKEALWESVGRYRLVVENMAEGLAILDENGVLTYVNDRVCELLGYGREEMVGSAAARFADEKTLSVLKEQLSKRRKGERSSYEAAWVRKDGGKIYTIVSAAPILDGDGKFTGSFAIFTDITERKQAEEALREAHESLRALIKCAPVAIVGLDENANVTSWNPAAELMFGWGEEEVLGRPYPLVPDDRQDEFDALRQQLLRAEAHTGIETRRRKKDDSLIDVSVSAAPLLDAEGKVVGAMAVLADMTERKQAEQALRESEERVRQLQKLEALGRLAGGVAHDFNNLLTAITGYSELLLRNLSEQDPLRKPLGEIKKAGERAAALTRQLLAFSRKQVLEPKVLDLNAVVANVEPMLRRLIGEDIELTTALDPGIGRVKADPGQIEQVMMNLVVNSRDAMPRGGKLTIETDNVYLDEEYARRHPEHTPGPYVVLAVSDTGVGMDEQTKAHIFEPFFTTKEEGTGLGLSTVYGIVKQSGGSIWVYSEPGQGTTFKVYLPRVEEPAESLQPAAAPAKSLRGTETVLVVEDEDMVRELACESLRMNGYDVLEARNPGEALLICERRQGAIHLMVTDVVMPGMSGPDLAKRLEPLHPEMKVLYMSGYTDNAIVHHGVLDPGVAFIQKPFTPDAFVRKVRQVLDTPQKPH